MKPRQGLVSALALKKILVQPMKREKTPMLVVGLRFPRCFVRQPKQVP